MTSNNYGNYNDKLHVMYDRWVFLMYDRWKCFWCTIDACVFDVRSMHVFLMYDRWMCFWCTIDGCVFLFLSFSLQRHTHARMPNSAAIEIIVPNRRKHASEPGRPHSSNQVGESSRTPQVGESSSRTPQVGESSRPLRSMSTRSSTITRPAPPRPPPYHSDNEYTDRDNESTDHNDEYTDRDESDSDSDEFETEILSRAPTFECLDRNEPISHTGQSRLSEYITPLGEIPTPIDVFRLFFTDQILADIKNNTNYYASVKDAGRRKGEREWQNVTVPELITFIAICIYLGLYRKGDLESQWGKDSRQPIHHILENMTLRRFQQIRRFLHISLFDDASAWRTNRSQMVTKSSPFVTMVIRGHFFLFREQLVQKSATTVTVTAKSKILLDWMKRRAQWHTSSKNYQHQDKHSTFTWTISSRTSRYSVIMGGQ